MALDFMLRDGWVGGPLALAVVGFDLIRARVGSVGRCAGRRVGSVGRKGLPGLVMIMIMTAANVLCCCSPLGLMIRVRLACVERRTPCTAS